MRKIRMMEHISLDGVIKPGGPDDNSEYAHGGWTAPYRTETGGQAIAEAQGKSFDLLLGRRTYDLWSSYWPKMKGGLFADNFNAATKYVVTHRPDSLPWKPAQGLGSHVIESIRDLKSQDGHDLLLWGSATLTTVLIEQGLIDEIVLAVYPLILGQGTRCFPDSGVVREFAFISSHPTAAGLLLNTYRYIGPLKTK